MMKRMTALRKSIHTSVRNSKNRTRYIPDKRTYSQYHRYGHFYGYCTRRDVTVMTVVVTMAKGTEVKQIDGVERFTVK